MRRRRRYARSPGSTQRWALTGAVVGLAIAAIVLALALSGQVVAGPAADAVAAIVAIPPFTLGPLRGLATGGEVLVTVAWWLLLGAVLGALVVRAWWGRLLAAGLVAVVALGHVAAYVAVQRDLGAAADALGAILTEAFRLGG